MSQGGNQDAIMKFVQGLAQTLQADPKQIVQIAQQNPDALEAAVNAFQQTQDMNQAAQAFQQTLQSKTVAAKHGAKLQYLKNLKHQCAEDEEVVYFKKGGSVDCGCQKKKGGEIEKAQNGTKTVSKFKNDYSSKKVKDSEEAYFNGTADHARYEPLKQELPKRKTQVSGKVTRIKSEYKPLKQQLPKKAQNSKNNEAVERFKKHRQGGSLNRIPFISKAQ